MEEFESETFASFYIRKVESMSQILVYFEKFGVFISILQGMFPTIKNCGQDLERYLMKNFETGKNVFDFCDLLARYSTNIISSVAFGIDNDCINDPNDIFRKMGAKILEPNLRNGIRMLFEFLMPDLFYKFGQRVVDSDVEEFLFSIVKQTVDHREQEKISRPDLIQLLIQLKNQGYLSVDSKNEDLNRENEAYKLNMNELTAQCLVFYVAGNYSSLALNLRR